MSSRVQKSQSQSRANNPLHQAGRGVVQKSLPFKCCALTLVPFESPACTIYDFKGSDGQKSIKYGIVFENAALAEFVWKHKKDPVTGNPLVSSKIIQLNMDQDSQTGQWQCPVLTKAFTDHTKIVAILTPEKTEANVYSYEAYHELNVKPKSYLDLTTGLKFHPKKDVLILNDPSNENFQKTVRDSSNFWHIKNARSGTLAKGSGSNDNNIRKSVTATRVMEQIAKQKKKDEEKRIKKAKAKAAAKTEEGAPTYEVPGSNLQFVVPTEDVTGIKYTTGSASNSLTSTAIGAASKNESRAATPQEILGSRLRLMKSWKGKKGYVNLVVEIRRDSKAPMRLPLLLELHCDIVPRTCCNFLGLCAQKKYDGTIFHRLILDFMIQGGGEKMKQQSTSSNKAAKDANLWGPEGFADEFDDRLKHTEGGGVLAMANAGPKTNKQQFYITLGKACPHLDRKHSVFGSVVKGMESFRKALVEEVTTDSKNRPTLEHVDTTNGETTVTNVVVVIVATEVLEDPAREAREFEDKRLKELHEIRKTKANSRKRLLNGKMAVESKSKSSESTSGVGKYLSKAFATPTDEKPQQPPPATGNPVFGKATSDVGLPDIGLSIAKPKKAKKTKFGDFSSW